MCKLSDYGVQCLSINICGLCTSNYEDAMHILFDCPNAVNVWRTMSLWPVIERAHEDHHVLRAQLEEQLLPVLLCNNNRRHDGKNQHWGISNAIQTRLSLPHGIVSWFGMCICEDEGSFVLAKTLSSTSICSTEVGEVLRLLHAISWVYDLQLINVDFEFDAKKVVIYYNNSHNDIA